MGHFFVDKKNLYLKLNADAFKVMAQFALTTLKLNSKK